MANIDKRSDTWREVEAFAQQERQDAVEALIADRLSDQQRGKIELIDELLRLATPSKAPALEP